MCLLSLPGQSTVRFPHGWNAARRAASVMSQGTPPRKTRGEKVGFLCLLGGNCPLHVHITSESEEGGKGGGGKRGGGEGGGREVNTFHLSVSH